MKKLIAIVVLAAVSVTPVFAQHKPQGNHYNQGYNHRNHQYYQHNHYPQHRHWNGYQWVAPAIIGGVVTYGLTRPYVIEQPPVYVQEVPATGCSAWREIQQPDGTIVRERTCYR